MRSGPYTIHQSLTPEAANIVKQALSLAKRRGHAQVSPLHVASCMLSSPTGLLRKACLQSNSHPLQCKALELCFNVALNRLPTSPSSPILSHFSHNQTSASNALAAAFKRAQAHQRRGSIESQQQPILALKVELEMLVVSILDDPSVSRVMREAGFSSTQVKTHVQKAVSVEVSSSKSTPMSFSQTTGEYSIRREDVASVLDAMVCEKRRSIVVLGECLASSEVVTRGVMDKIERGDVHGDLRFVKCVSLPLFTLKNLSRGEVEEKIGELRRLVRGILGRGVVLYLGDLKWVAEFWSECGEQKKGYYCPVEHMIMELSRFLGGILENGKLWIMGIANFQTYVKCKKGHPSLESLWKLHPLTIPDGNLSLSLNLESDLKFEFRNKESSSSGDGSLGLLHKAEIWKQLSCCADCLANFSREAQTMANNVVKRESTTTSTSSSLPSWLQQYNHESKRQKINDQDYDKVGDLCKKWNSICTSVHKHPHFLEKSFHFSSSTSPSSSNSLSSHDHFNPIVPKEYKFFISENKNEIFEHNSRTFVPITRQELLSNPNSSPNSASSSEISGGDLDFMNNFKELNSENLKKLCDSLEKKVPWHREIIPDIVSTVLKCRSRMIPRRRRSDSKGEEFKEETWLFFLGADSEGKQKIGRELAKTIFGSQSKFASIGLSSVTSTRADSNEELMRDDKDLSYFERFAEAMAENQSRVFFMEDLEQVDYNSQMGIKRAIESGSVVLPCGDLIPLKDAIVIFSTESLSSASRACSPPVRRISGEEEAAKTESFSLDLNIATEEDCDGDEHSVSEIGIIDSVDRLVVFKMHLL